MTSTTTPHNYSYQAIPAAFMLGIVPHGYGLARLMLATKNTQSLAMPRTNLDTWKGKLPTELWNHLARARGAHLNSMEVFPLIATALVAGNVAKLPAEDLNNVAVSWFTARVVYMGLYLSVKSDAWAYARTGAYAWSIAIPIMALWRAGQKAANEL